QGVGLAAAIVWVPRGRSLKESPLPVPVEVRSPPVRVLTRALAGVAGIVALVVPAAVAAQPSLDLRGFHAPTDPASGLYLEPAASPDTGDYNAALWLNYVYRPIVLRDPAT